MRLRAVGREADVLVGPLVELAGVAALSSCRSWRPCAAAPAGRGGDVGELLEVAVGPSSSRACARARWLTCWSRSTSLEMCTRIASTSAPSSTISRGPLPLHLPVHVARHHARAPGPRAPRPVGRTPRRRPHPAVGEEGGDHHGDGDADPPQRVGGAVELLAGRATRSVSRTASRSACGARDRVEQRLADRRIGATERVARGDHRLGVPAAPAPAPPAPRSSTWATSGRLAEIVAKRRDGGGLVGEAVAVGGRGSSVLRVRA